MLVVSEGEYEYRWQSSYRKRGTKGCEGMGDKGVKELTSSVCHECLLIQPNTPATLACECVWILSLSFGIREPLDQASATGLHL